MPTFQTPDQEPSRQRVTRRKWMFSTGAGGMLAAASLKLRAAEKLRLTLACWDYDRTRPLMDGRVQVDGIDLTYLNLPVEETFFRMLHETRSSTPRRCHYLL